eukprot:TRINITY_DN2770_c0_g1_i1.p1 TRINITY_DN2770_c0_g1~~TRINITY_DN2770_c0_g1_i1.p1  ORF type:complete len:505 (+),score=201.34 TRINITY_DN2770_c0_g1_i1:80-1594(+)
MSGSAKWTCDVCSLKNEWMNALCSVCGRGERPIDVDIEGKMHHSVPGVRLYRIQPPNKSKVASGSFNIIEIQNLKEKLIFARCDEFTYPLVGQPCVRIDERHYVFPAGEDDAAVAIGMVIDTCTPDDCLKRLEKTFSKHTDLRTPEDVSSVTQVPSEATAVVEGTAAESNVTKYSRVISSHLEAGSKVIGAGLVTGAEYCGSGIRKGGRYLKGKLKKKEKETEVGPKTKTAIKATKEVSTAAVVLSSQFVMGVKLLATGMVKGVSAAVSATSLGKKMDGSCGPKTQATKTLIGGSVGAFVNLFDALATAGMCLVKDTGSATHDVVEHRYGKELGDVVKDGAQASVNIGKTVVNVKKAGAVTVLKTVVKSEGMKPSKSEANRQIQQTTEKATTRYAGVVNTGVQKAEHLVHKMKNTSITNGQAPVAVAGYAPPTAPAAAPQTNGFVESMARHIDGKTAATIAGAAMEHVDPKTAFNIAATVASKVDPKTAINLMQNVGSTALKQR